MATLSQSHARASSRVRRTVLIVLAVLAVLGIAFAVAIHYATRTVEARVLEALGPDSEVDEVTVGLHEVRLAGLRVKAPKGWPADTALRAEEVIVTPKLKQLFSDRVEITEVHIRRAYLSAVRPQSGGGLRLLPSVTERAKKGERDGKRGVAVRAVRFEDCTIDLYDATVPLKPQRVRIDDVSGSIEDVEVPDRGARTKIDLDGALKGPVHRGTVSVKGWVDVDRKSSELSIALRNVDLAMFEPYIFTRVKAGVESGSFGLSFEGLIRALAIMLNGLGGGLGSAM